MKDDGQMEMTTRRMGKRVVEPGRMRTEGMGMKGVRQGGWGQKESQRDMRQGRRGTGGMEMRCVEQ